MQLIKIGKSPSNDIYKELINDPTVSRVHCEIFIDDDGNVFLSDLNSTNGTYVNGNKINKPIKLHDLDIIRAGNSLVKWQSYIKGDKNNLNSDLDINLNDTKSKNNLWKWILAFIVLFIVIVVGLMLVFY